MLLCACCGDPSSRKPRGRFYLTRVEGSACGYSTPHCPCHSPAPALQTSETCKRSNANSPEIITALYAANSASDRSADDQSQKRLESFLQMRSILRGQRRKSISKALRVSLTATRDTASLLDRRDAARTHPRPERSVFYWSLHVASTTLSFLSRRADASSGVKMISVFFGASFSVRKLLRLK